jgi:subtilisin family serine protease
VRRPFLSLPSLLLFALPVAADTFILESASGTTAAAVAAKRGMTVVRLLKDNDSRLALVSGPASTPALIAMMKADPSVAQFEVDGEVDAPEKGAVGMAPSLTQLAGAISDTKLVNYYGDTVREAYSAQPTVGLIHLVEAQKSYGLGSGIVAVIDSGIDPNHPVLANSIVPGYDFLANRAGVPNELAELLQSTVGLLDQSTVGLLDQSTVGLLDRFFPAVLNQSTVGLLDQSTVGLLDATRIPSDFGHGTMVSGLIHLVAPNAKIMPLRAFQPQGTGQLSDIISAIYFAVQHGAKVINMSFSFTSSSPELAKAIAYANSHGVICVAAAGNAGQRAVVYPAGLPNVVGVGSTTATDLRSVFSNYGVYSVDMGAPGEALITSYPAGHYAGVWGTSFSSALVSGTVALMARVNPDIRAGDVSDNLDHGKPLADGVDEGDVRLDVLQALTACWRNR